LEILPVFDVGHLEPTLTQSRLPGRLCIGIRRPKGNMMHRALSHPSGRVAVSHEQVNRGPYSRAGPLYAQAIPVRAASRPAKHICEELNGLVIGEDRKCGGVNALNRQIRRDGPVGPGRSVGQVGGGHQLDVKPVRPRSTEERIAQPLSSLGVDALIGETGPPVRERSVGNGKRDGSSHACSRPPIRGLGPREER